MKYNKMQDILLELKNHRYNVFNLNDAAKLMNKSNKYTSKLLNSNKHIKKIENGKYYIDEGTGIDLYQIASNIVYPSYISLFSAFEFYSITEQTIKKYSVVTPIRHRDIVIDNNIIEFNFMKKERFFGYTRNNNIYIAAVEKAIIDSLYFQSPELSYVVEAFNRAIDLDIIDLNKLIEYTRKMNSKILERKVDSMIHDYNNRDDKND